jgi:hypothetical protein
MGFGGIIYIATVTIRQLQYVATYIDNMSLVPAEPGVKDE